MDTTAKKKETRGQPKRGGRKVKKAAAGKRRETLDAMLNKMELRRLSENALPYQIIHNQDVTATWDDDHGEHELLRHEWDQAVCEIARAALRRGYRLLVPVYRDEIAFATCEIVKALGIPVHVWHSRRRESLIVGLLEDQIQQDETDGEEGGEATRVA